MEIINVTLNPNDMGTGNVLSNNNLTVTRATTTAIRATHGKTSGKWYWEVKYDAGDPRTGIGISNKTFPTSSFNSNYTGNNNWRGLFIQNGNKVPENTVYGSAFKVGDIIGLALDLDSGKLEFYNNGVSLGVSHTNVKELGEVYPTAGSGSSFTTTVTFNFGATPFAYEIPKGFYSYDGRQNNAYNKFLISSDDKYYSFHPNGVTLPLASNVTTSSSGVGSEGWRVFDGIKDSSYWQTTNGTSGWLKCDFGEGNGKNIVSYIMYPSNNSPSSRSPKSWTLEGSNMGSFAGEEIILDIQSDISGWSLGVAKTFSVNNSRKFRFYRLNISQNSGATSLVNLGELELIAKGEMKELKTTTEGDFLKHGIEKNISIDVSESIEDRVFIAQSFEILGSGKVFKQIIDTTKIPIKKASIT